MGGRNVQFANLRRIFRPWCETTSPILFTFRAAEISRTSRGNGPSESTSISAPPVLRHKIRQPQCSSGLPKYIWPVLRLARDRASLLYSVKITPARLGQQTRSLVSMLMLNAASYDATDIAGAA
jgi:hypothetical protein